MGKKIPTTVKDQDLVAQRRGEIVDVATRLFLERGFHNTSIRDIARACPFNLASLYMYVSSKEDILFLVAQQLIDEKAKAMAEVEISEDDPEASFRTALRSYCRIVHDYRPHVRTGIDKGVFANVEPRLVALDALFLCHLWSLHARALRSIVVNIDEFFDMQVKILLRGLLARQGDTNRKSKRSARAATVNAAG